MNKRIIALVLLFVMLLPVSLASCNKETEAEEKALKLYTLYTICGDSTTPEAIREVELALNRITAYQLGIGVLLNMVTEDEYDKLIEDKFKEIADYQEEQKRLKDEEKKNKNNSSAVTSDDSSEAPEDVLTADRFIDILVANQETGDVFELDAPRLDIFLVRGLDNYTNLVGDGMLAELDEKLSSEAKLIKDKIYPTFLSAAKVTNSAGKQKTYGIPMNTVIGEYEYVVFDEELLNKYEIDAMTMNTLEDLEYYLRIIKENEPDVVPLANAFDSTYCTYLFHDGFPAMVDSEGVVVNPYDDDKALDYYTYISRYRSLGYLGDENDNRRFAVKFVKGTFEDLEALEKETGHSYVSAIHSYPVATNENTLKNLFCVSKYTVSNELTEVATLLSLIETNAEVANILAYGVENVHYQLDENNQVVRLSNDYVVSTDHIGNAFLLHTMAGENPNKWEMFKQQNLDSAKGEEQAKSLGFIYYPQTVADPDDKNVIFEEPNYISIISPIVDSFYKKIMDGTAIEFDSNQLVSEVKSAVDASLIAQVEAKYIEDLTSQHYRRIDAYYDSEDFISTIRDRAYDMAIESFIVRSFRNTVKRDLNDELKAKYPDLSKDELDALVTETMTDDYLKEQVKIRISEKEIESKANSIIVSTTNDRKDKDKKALETDAAFLAEKQAVLNSAECLAEKQAVLGADNYYLYQDEIAKVVKERLKGLSADLRKEMSNAIKKEYNSFIDSMTDKYNYRDEEKRSTALYNTALDTLAAVDKNLRAIRRDLTSTVKAEMPEDTKAEDIDVEVEKRMTPEYLREALLRLDLVTDSQIRTAYNEALEEHINDAVGFVKKSGSSAGKDDDTSSDDSSADTSEAPDEEPDDDEPVEDLPITEDSDYFELFFTTRIKAQYYTFAPLPEGVTG